MAAIKPSDISVNLNFLPPVLIANEYILKGLTIIKPKTGAVNIHNYVDTNTSDVFDKWLHQNVEFNI